MTIYIKSIAPVKMITASYGVEDLAKDRGKSTIVAHDSSIEATYAIESHFSITSRSIVSGKYIVATSNYLPPGEERLRCG